MLTGSTESVVKRPAFGKKKNRSSLRMSFGPSDDAEGDEAGKTPVVTPKKSNLNRIAAENRAQLTARSPLASDAPERPSYNKDYIAELRNSTPATPKDLTPSVEEKELSQTLDIASKFGSTATLTAEAPSAIPTQAEIQEKKARRRRLAQEDRAYDDEEERPWASDDDDEFRMNRNEISLRPKDKYAETRLVHEDEDIAEGFDEYVEDGRIALGRKSEREAQKKRRAEMAELINEAEGGSDDDGTEDSDQEMNDRFAIAQARAGRYGQKGEDEDDGSKTPPRITPLPDLDDILERLQAGRQAKEQKREAILKKLEELKDDKVRIAERKQYLQEQLQKTAEEFQKLQLEKGESASPASGMDVASIPAERGLESLGTTPVEPRSRADSEE